MLVLSCVGWAAIHKTYGGRVASFPIYTSYSPTNKYKLLGGSDSACKSEAAESCWPSLSKGRRKRGKPLCFFIWHAVGQREEEIHHLEQPDQQPSSCTQVITIFLYFMSLHPSFLLLFSLLFSFSLTTAQTLSSSFIMTPSLSSTDLSSPLAPSSSLTAPLSPVLFL